MVVIEELNGIGERLCGIFKSFIHQQWKISLLVSPVYLKQRLESGKELLHFIERTLDDVTDDVFMVDVKLILLNPS
jgi:hypothetical protein